MAQGSTEAGSKFMGGWRGVMGWVAAERVSQEGGGLLFVGRFE